METTLDTITINGIEYVKRGNEPTPAAKRDGMPYCIVRTYSAGVFAGYVESRNGKEAVIRDARRLWYWRGAASLSQMAMTGTSKPKECQFPVAVDRVELTEVIEVLACTEKARLNIAEVPVWTA